MRLSPARAAQITGGAVLAAAVVIGAGAAVFAPLPGRTHDPIRVQAQPPAAPAVAVCSGPLLAAGRDATQASLLGDGAPQQITVGATAGADLTDALLTPADVAAGAGPAVQTATPPASSSDPADLAVAGSAQVAASDLTGFAAEACTRASMESWLVGGSGTTGAGDLVVLANPGDVAAQVTLAVYGATGAQTPAAGKNIVVPARTQRVIPLAAIALGEENPVVRVTSAQAPVRASLQATLTRVLNPGGVDQIAALGAPTTDLVIPAVPVTVPPGDPGASNTPTSLRRRHLHGVDHGDDAHHRRRVDDDGVRRGQRLRRLHTGGGAQLRHTRCGRGGTVAAVVARRCGRGRSNRHDRAARRERRAADHRSRGTNSPSAGRGRHRLPRHPDRQRAGLGRLFRCGSRGGVSDRGGGCRCRGDRGLSALTRLASVGVPAQK
ncbi:MAG: hypothetical protein DI577_02950 [Microbacterium sp.]|nr:MAG: hypothetical protein DI577_02950 [Microbacterium sp.]PZU37435.1 MAG: hypothetical protein DI575_02950 [Microbacterium sp.]